MKKWLIGVICSVLGLHVVLYRMFQQYSVHPAIFKNCYFIKIIFSCSFFFDGTYVIPVSMTVQHTVSRTLNVQHQYLYTDTLRWHHCDRPYIKITLCSITASVHRNHHALWSANLFEALTLCTSLIPIPSSLCGTKYPETAEGFLSAATLNCLERVSASVASLRTHVPWNDWDASVNGFIRNGFETAERTVKWSPRRWIGWL